MSIVSVSVSVNAGSIISVSIIVSVTEISLLYSAGKRSHSSPLQSGFQCGFVYAMSITKENQTENQTVAERYAGHICPQARLAVHSGCMQLRA